MVITADTNFGVIFVAEIQEIRSEISINLVFGSQCYFASIFYSIAYVFI